jgi:hypothetical protein
VNLARKTIAPATSRRREEETKLRDLFAAAPDGTRFSWVELTIATGIDMQEERAKRLVKAVLKRMGRPYIPLTGHGIELSSSVSAIDIHRKRVRAIHGSLVRMEDTDRQILERHGEDLPPADRHEIDKAQAIRGMLMLGVAPPPKRVGPKT